MTEAEWNICTDPQAMLKFLRGKVSDRKLRLFACACNRRLPYVMRSEDKLRVLEVAERLADGTASSEEVSDAYPATAPPPLPPGRYCVIWEDTIQFFNAVIEKDAERAAALWGWCSTTDVLPEIRTHLLRDIFGHLPIRPVTFDAAWHTTAVTQLAEGIYQERAFDRLPILADALEESGCDNAGILTHCRGEGPHVRGCWALDLLLSKA